MAYKERIRFILIDCTIIPIILSSSIKQNYHNHGYDYDISYQHLLPFLYFANRFLIVFQCKQKIQRSSTPKIENLLSVS